MAEGTAAEVCILTRIHDAKPLSALDAALFSLLGQVDISIKSIILCQEISDEKFEQVEDLCQTYRNLGLNTRCFNERFEGDDDHRAELLNRGLDRCDSNYLAFLDCDDVVYPGMYAKLVKRLHRKSAAVAFGGCVRADYYKLDGNLHFSTKSMLFQSLPAMRFFLANQYPIHSYVIDLSKVDREDLFFDKGQSRNEDYAFLFRLLRKYESDRFYVATKTCEYRVDIGGSNTIMAFGADAESVKAWALAEEYMNDVRRDSKITVSFEDIMDFSASLPEDGWHKPKVSEAAKAERYGAQLGSMILSQDHDLQELDFYIDSVESNDRNNLRVTGWLHGDGDPPFMAVCADADGRMICYWDEFVPRTDVAAAYKLQSNELGFSIRIPSNFDMVTIKAMTEDNRCFVSPPFSLREKLA